MSKPKDARPLHFVFVLLVTVVIGGLFYKDRLFDWNYLQPTIKLLLFLIWFTLGLSLLGVITIFIIGKLRSKHERLRIILLASIIASCICCLLMEIGAYFEFHGGQQCFPYNLNAKIGFQPPFLPLSLEVDTQGNISLSGNTSISLEIGTINVGTDVGRLPTPNNEDNMDNSTTILIIRHYEGSKIVDTKYQLHSKLDSVQIVTTGRTITELKKNYYFIDASQGNLESTQVNIFPVNSACSTTTSS